MEASFARGSANVRVAFMLALGSACWAMPTTARCATAKWTEIVIAEGAYAQMQERLQRVGATDDVNVVVMHNTGESLKVYSLQKDGVAGHTPGQCCAAGAAVGSCCGVSNIPLADVGVSEQAITVEMVGKFLSYAQTKFPAEHYMLVLRGEPGDGASSIYQSGFTVVELRQKLEEFAKNQGGRNIDILSMSYCLSGSTDWSYNFAGVVDYYVAPANWTNSPVAARWRVQRWAQELIEAPTLGSREVAMKMVDVFAEDGSECASGCTNLSQGEPWTAAASDLSQSKAYSDAMRDFVCAYLKQFDPVRDKPIFEAAKQATVPYGATNQDDIQVEHYDIKHFAMNLRERLADAGLKEKLSAFIAAHDKYTFKYALEPKGFSAFSDNAFGLSGYFNVLEGPPATVYSSPPKIGPWMTRSMWKAFLAKTAAIDVSVNLTPSGLVVDAPKLQLQVGESLVLTARGANTTFPDGMCEASDVTWQIDDGSLASLVGTSGNPVKLTARAPGRVTVTATADEKKASIEVTIGGSTGAAGAAGSGPAASGASAGGGGTGGNGTNAGSGGANSSAGVPSLAGTNSIPGGAGDSSDSSGCGCRIGCASPKGDALALFGMMALAHRLRSRRRRSNSPG